MRTLVLLVASAGLLLARCASEGPLLPIGSPYRDPSTLEAGQILHLATGRLLSEPELIDYLAAYRVVYLGESHDNVEAHAVELAVLAGLEKRAPGGVALGLEMLRRPDQASLDAYLRGAMDEKTFVQLWERSWGPRTFPYYRDILNLAKEKRIPVLALNAGRDLSDAVAKSGIEGLDAADAKRLPQMNLEDPYEHTFLKAIFRAHRGGPRRMELFEQVQVLWEETMAQTAADYLAGSEGRQRRLLIFSGADHVCYGFGIPRRLFRRLPLAYSIVSAHAVDIPEGEVDELMDVDLPELPMRPADVYWAVSYRSLADRRVMLGVQIEPVAGGGLRVLAVAPGSPAEDAGVQVGDVIVSTGGRPVESAFDLTYELDRYQPGEIHPLALIRGDRRLELDVSYEKIRHGH